MEYNVGDKVYIIKRKNRECNYPFSFTNEMTVYSGRIAIITNKYSVSNYTSCNELEKDRFNSDPHKYLINIDAHCFLWHSSMFRPVSTNMINIF